MGDIKEILISFVSLQIEYDTKLEREWSAMSPIVNGIECEMGSGARDGEGVRYTENPLPPKAPADGENPFADEDTSV